MKFRKKSVVIDAFQWQPGVPASDSPSWYREACTAQMIWGVLSGGCLIRSPDGTQFAKPGDWILRDSKGNLHRCKPDIFAATYEPADVPAPALTQDVQTMQRLFADRAQRARSSQMSSPTPGPWRHEIDGDLDNDMRHAVLAEINDLWVAACYRSGTTAKNDSSKEADEEAAANARLIAAAPELLRACQTFETWLRREEAGLPGGVVRDTPEGEARWREWYDENLRLCAEAQTQARAAIEKATGGSHG